MWHKKFNILIKIAISLGLLYLVSLNVDFSQSYSKLSSIRPIYFLSAFLILMLIAVFQSLRWARTIAICKQETDFYSAFREIWVGNLFNQILPTSIGGDAIRIFRLSKIGMNYKLSIASVFLDRFGALIITFFFSLISLAIIFNIAEIIVTIIPLGLVFSLYIFKKYILNINKLKYIFSILLKKSNSGNYFIVILYSLIIQVLIGSLVSLIAHSCGIKTNYLLLGIIFQLILLSSVLPISFAGWGLREFFMVEVLKYINIPKEDALMISVLYGIFVAISSLIGCFYLTKTSKMRLKYVN